MGIDYFFMAGMSSISSVWLHFPIQFWKDYWTLAKIVTAKEIRAT